MAIRVNGKVLILEIPKTGTTWIRYALNVLQIPHRIERARGRACQRHSARQHYAPARVTVATVRHPYEWVKSYWTHQRGVDWSKFDIHHYPHKEFVPEDRTFEQYVSMMCEHSLHDYFHSFHPDKWMKNETLEESFLEILEIAGIGDVSLDRLQRVPLQNVSRSVDAYCSDEVRQAFLTAQQPMLERWGYEG